MDRAAKKNNKVTSDALPRRLVWATAVTLALVLVYIPLWLTVGRAWATSWAGSFGLVGYSILNILVAGYFVVLLKYHKTWLDITALIFAILAFLLNFLNILAIGRFCASAAMDFACMVVAFCAMMILLNKIRKQNMPKNMRAVLVIVPAVFMMMAFFWAYTGWFPYIGEHPVEVIIVGAAGLVWVAMNVMIVYTLSLVTRQR